MTKKIEVLTLSGFTRITIKSGKTESEPYNTIDDETLREIADCLDGIDAAGDSRAVVLWGGNNFAVGANLEELMAKGKETLLTDSRRSYWQRIAGFPKPLIAAVNGYALGAGNELVMLSDIVVVGRSAQLGQPEINLGLIPGAGGTQRLIRTVGKSLAMEMVLSGRFLTGDEALRSGLASRLCEDELTLETAEKIAEKISRLSPTVLKAAKAALLQSYEEGLTAGMEYEYRKFAGLADTYDREEGIKAFLEKRSPKFEGR